MKKAILCCISCILPCGALDVIRIVHANGRVEEISGCIRACEVMKAYPKHVLKKPTSSSSMVSSSGGGGANEMPRIVILPPDAELERGKIYFLMPVPAPPPPSNKPARRRRRSGRNQKEGGEVVAESSKHQQRSTGYQRVGDEVSVAAETKHPRRSSKSSDGGSTISLSLLSLSTDQYLSEIMSEKLSTQRERKRGRVGVWRPHLESICESPGDTQSILWGI